MVSVNQDLAMTREVYLSNTKTEASGEPKYFVPYRRYAYSLARLGRCSPLVLMIECLYSSVLDQVDSQGIPLSILFLVNYNSSIVYHMGAHFEEFLQVTLDGKLLERNVACRKSILMETSVCTVGTLFKVKKIRGIKARLVLAYANPFGTCIFVAQSGYLLFAMGSTKSPICPYKMPPFQYCSHGYEPILYGVKD